MKMLKHLNQIVPRPTSHGVGLKRVLLSGDETESAVTQIAVTRLAEGEVAAEHRHESMEEYFYFLKGVAAVCVDGCELLCREGDFLQVECGSCVDGCELLCREGDFLQVECGSRHSVLAKSEVEMLTVGVAV